VLDTANENNNISELKRFVRILPLFISLLDSVPQLLIQTVDHVQDAEGQKVCKKR
jgi:hypothetical protein